MAAKSHKQDQALPNEPALKNFGRLYGTSGQLMMQYERYTRVLKAFEERFGDGAVMIFSAPGRTEIGGNHTDHQHGKVLAASVDVDIAAVAAPLEEPVAIICSQGYEEIRVSLEDLTIHSSEEGTSQALVRGVAAGLKERGYSIGGFKACMTSSVLSGSGLSSSAAYEIMIGTILSGLYNDGGIDPVTLAQTGQLAENVYFGKPSGLMDQMACSVGGLVYIDFKDPGNPVTEQVQMNLADYGYCLCIVNTGGSHADLTDAYASIPDECRQIAAYFGRDYLRDVPEEDFMQAIPKLRVRAGDRAVLRDMHIYGENRRVDAELTALKKGDFEAFLDIVRASGRSSFQYLQNVTVPGSAAEQNMPLALALSENLLGGRGASRVHGGGFAGTIQAYVPVDMIDTYRQRMEQVLGAGACQVMQIRGCGGVCF